MVSGVDIEHGLGLESSLGSGLRFGQRSGQRFGQRSGQRSGVPAPLSQVELVNIEGGSDILLVCDHASNHVPESLQNLGLDLSTLTQHMAWDIGAAALTRKIAARLDATAVLARNSRLVIDCNRSPEALDLIPTTSDGVEIKANLALSPEARMGRINAYHVPFHEAIEQVINSRQGDTTLTCVISIHSYTPHMNGQNRPWHMGLLYEDDEALALSVHAQLAKEEGLVIGLNQPYAPKDGVYYTLNRHAKPNGLQSLMIEVRNDLLLTHGDIEACSMRLAKTITTVITQKLTLRKSNTPT